MKRANAGTGWTWLLLHLGLCSIMTSLLDLYYVPIHHLYLVTARLKKRTETKQAEGREKEGKEEF